MFHLKHQFIIEIVIYRWQRFMDEKTLVRISNNNKKPFLNYSKL